MTKDVVGWLVQSGGFWEVFKNEHIAREIAAQLRDPAGVVTPLLQGDVAADEIESLHADREKNMADFSRAIRIMTRAISWIEIRLAAVPSAKGQSIIDEMRAWCAGSPAVEPSADSTPLERAFSESPCTPIIDNALRKLGEPRPTFRYLCGCESELQDADEIVRRYCDLHEKSIDRDSLKKARDALRTA